MAKTTKKKKRLIDGIMCNIVSTANHFCCGQCWEQEHKPLRKKSKKLTKNP